MTNDIYPLLDESLINENIVNYNLFKDILMSFFRNNANIENVINNPVLLYDFDYLIEQYYDTLAGEDTNKIRKELFKINMEEINDVLDSTSLNDDVLEHFYDFYRSMGKGIDDVKLINNLSNDINSQYFNTARIYKMKKGTYLGYDFIFSLLGKTGLEPLFKGAELEIKELDEPFKYQIKSQVPREILKDTLLKITHPCGFEYSFVSYDYIGFDEFYSFYYETFYNSIIFKQNDGTIIFSLEKESDYSTNLISSYYDGIRNFNVTDDEVYGTLVEVLFINNFYFKELMDRTTELFLKLQYNEIYTVQEDSPIEVKDIYDVGTNLEILITNIELINIEIGELYYEVGNKENSINNGKYLFNFKLKEAKTLYIVGQNSFKVRYTIAGDSPNQGWYYADIPIIDPVVSQDNKKVYEDINFTKEDILKDFNYNGVYLKKFDTTNYFLINKTENNKLDLIRDELYWDMFIHIGLYTSQTFLLEDIFEPKPNEICRKVQIGMETTYYKEKLKIGGFKIGSYLLEEVDNNISDFYWDGRSGSKSYINADDIFIFDVFDEDGNKVEDDNRSASE